MEAICSNGLARPTQDPQARVQAIEGETRAFCWALLA